MPAIIQCMIGFLMLLWRLCCKVYRVCCCCGRRSVKMMKAPGTAGAVIISRALFESNPAAYFTNLRAGGIHVS
ncbi:Protein EGG APPARATUS-1 [Bienertia sinuspersici]